MAGTGPDQGPHAHSGTLASIRGQPLQNTTDHRIAPTWIVGAARTTEVGHLGRKDEMTRTEALTALAVLAMRRAGAMFLRQVGVEEGWKPRRRDEALKGAMTAEGRAPGGMMGDQTTGMNTDEATGETTGETTEGTTTGAPMEEDIRVVMMQMCILPLLPGADSNLSAGARAAGAVYCLATTEKPTKKLDSRTIIAMFCRVGCQFRFGRLNGQIAFQWNAQWT